MTKWRFFKGCTIMHGFLKVFLAVNHTFFHDGTICSLSSLTSPIFEYEEIIHTRLQKNAPLWKGFIFIFSLKYTLPFLNIKSIILFEPEKYYSNNKYFVQKKSIFIRNISEEDTWFESRICICFDAKTHHFN